MFECVVFYGAGCGFHSAARRFIRRGNYTNNIKSIFYSEYLPILSLREIKKKYILFNYIFRLIKYYRILAAEIAEKIPDIKFLEKKKFFKKIFLNFK